MSPVQQFDEVVHCVASLARLLGDNGNAREHVFDAVIEFGNEQVLTLFRLLSIGNIKCQPAHAYKLPGQRSNSALAVCSSHISRPSFRMKRKVLSNMGRSGWRSRI